MGLPSTSNKQTIFIWFLLAFYLLVPIGIIMKVLDDILTSIEKSVDFLIHNYTQTKNMTSESELNNISYSFLLYKDEDFK